MLDIKTIIENPEALKKGAQNKNISIDIDKLIETHQSLTTLQRQIEDKQAQRKLIAKEMAKLSPEMREVRREEATQIRQDIENIQEELAPIGEAFKELMLRVPQPAREDVPVGKDDSDNLELRKWGKLPEFDFAPKSHDQLGTELGLMDFPRGVKLAGSRSYVLCGDGSRLEQALLRFAYDHVVKRGFKPMTVPVLVEEPIMEGTGYFPVGRDQSYYIEKDELALVGTAEVSLCGLHQNEILNKEDLPIKMMALSSCFRREAGTYGKDTKGLYRVHQFQKIEMVVLGEADEEKSAAYHDELLETAESLMQALELPYRVVYVCTGDLGQGQVRKHDIEAWMPSRAGYGETHSCSTFYDFQARRLGIRYRSKDSKKKQLVHTLNNTACATPRLLIPIIENYQTADGRVRIPACLRPYMDGKEFIGSR